MDLTIGVLTVGATGTCTNTMVAPFLTGPHGALWDSNGSVHNLGNLGAGVGINIWGDIVGASVTAACPASGNARAFLWHKGRMSDLNALIPANSFMYLITAFSINDEGQIAGFGVVTSGPNAGNPHGFLATPKF
jgi:probable HAF family extracellular repeat protein